MVTGRNPSLIPYPWIDGLTKRQQEQIYLDFEWLASQGTGTRWATIVVAPSDATTKSKNKADVLLDGTSDATKLQAAIETLDGRSTPGRIVILEGTVYLTSAVTIDMSGTTTGRLQIVGMGGFGSDTATKITNSSGSNNLFTIGGPSGSTTRVGFNGLNMTSGSGACIATNATAVDIDACSFSGSGRLLDLGGGLSGPYAPSRVRNCSIDTGGSSSSRGIVATYQFGIQISGCKITASSGRAISIFADAAATMQPTIANNRISGSTSAIGIYIGSSTDATNTQDFVVTGNWISTFSDGIYMEGVANGLIGGNAISGCVDGIQVTGAGIIGNSKVLISGNYIYNCTSEGVNIDASTLGTSDIAVVFNKFRGNTAQGSIAASCSNCAWAYNDAYLSGSFTDSGTSTRTEASYLPTVLDANARVGVRVNTGASTYLRRRLNLIEGTDFSVSASDDSGSEEVDITLGLAGTITSNARVAVSKNSGATVGTRRRINFIEGSGATLTIADDSVNEEVDVTIAVSAGAGGGDTSGQIVAIWDGGGSTIDVTKTVDVVAPYAGTITDWEVLLDTATTVSVDVWKDVYANYPPTAADKISASAPPNTSAADHAASSTLTGWSTTITAGDIFRFKPSAVGTATKMTVIINYSRP